MASSYSEIGSGPVQVSDRQNLLVPDEEDPPPRGYTQRCCAYLSKHRWCFSILAVIGLILLGHAIAVYFIYFHCNLHFGLMNCKAVKIMAFNTWGMPAAFGSKDKPERMQAIANEISKGHYDLYLLSELWMQGDHETIAAHIPSGYHITGFRELALSDCDGRATPFLCSGLAIVSKFPFKHTEFNSYTYHGDPMKSTIDGEWLARKGVGLAKIKVLNATVDVFVTHTAADPDPKLHNYTNEYYRIRQVKELMATYVKKAKGDVVVLGGDFNAGPVNKPGNEYYIIRQYMKNCIEEVLYKLRAWLNPSYATYGNQENTFSNGSTPIIYDYVFYHVNKPSLKVWTSLFELPFFKTLLHIADHTEKISFSDHEAITTTLYIWD